MERLGIQALERFIDVCDNAWSRLDIQYFGLWRNHGWDGPANSFELAYYIQGRNTIVQDGDAVLAKEGHLLFLPDTIRNSRSEGGRFKAYYLSFGFGGDAELEASVRDLFASIAPGGRPLLAPGLEASFAELLIEVQARRSPPFRVKHAFLHILIQAHQALLGPDGGSPTHAGGRHRQLVDTVMKELNESYGTRMRLSDIAGRVGMNERYLNHVFKSVTGTTLGRQLTRIRIDHAKRLLVTTRLPVTEIALEVGFYDAAHFTKMFRSSELVSPSGYRASRLQESSATIPPESK
jgi:AraC-like DNA-binding protein